LHDPIEHVSVNLGSNDFHQVAGERIAGGRVNVNEAKTRIKSKRGGSKPGFRFEQGIEVIQHGIRGICRQAR
jgi:hypothetical protein